MSAAVDKHQTPVMSEDNALKLGIFGINMRGGVTLVEFDGMVQATWEENVRYAQLADRIGIDAIVPVARWRGYGGRSNLGDVSFETFTWAAGLLAVTSRIMVFSTFHVPVGHPLLAAKMGATADHISGGRWGLNIVAGWNPEELAMFGVDWREHDDRYAVATSGRRCSSSCGPSRARATSMAATSTSRGVARTPNRCSAPTR